MSFKNLIMYSFAAGVIIFSSCAREISNSTGWNYNDPKNGGYEKFDDFHEQETGPGLVLVEGGSFMMGRIQEDVMFDWNNVSRKVSVSSFYMDETEVTNLHYREYLHWIIRVFTENPNVYWNALPDTLVWRSKLSYNEPMIQHYFRNASFQNYPVVGVSWVQANDFCLWRTDRVNERILIREGVLKENTEQLGAENFNTESYMNSLYEGSVGDNIIDLNPSNTEGRRIVREEDGILLPKYRLPTEAEWEFAALSVIGTSVDERIYERRVYPWTGHQTRNPAIKERGRMMANFTRGRGDQMGVAGRLNDMADITAPVYSYWPNDYGLYCMAGNVNEWVLDVYRANTSSDADEFRPFRGNVFERYKKNDANEMGTFSDRDSLGRMVKMNITEEDAYGRKNYRSADNKNYLDGDQSSSIDYREEIDSQEKLYGSNLMYQQKNLPDKTLVDSIGPLAQYKETVNKDNLYNETGWFTLVNDHSRVYKGGSWRDRAYFLAPGSRRFLDEKKAKDDLGFRCAMTRLGKPTSY